MRSEITELGDQKLSERFSVTAKVIWTGTAHVVEYLGGVGTVTVVSSREWEVEGSFHGKGRSWIDDGTPLDRVLIPSRPARTSMADGGEIEVTQEFTCIRPGPATVLYRFTVHFTDKAESRIVILAIPISVSKSMNQTAHTSFECVASFEGTPTPTPTPMTVIELTNLPPRVSPISARFDPEARTTFYDVIAIDPEGDPISYRWRLTSSDPNCTDFKFINDRAEWHHPHPPCGDTTSHPGSISVTVRDPYFRVHRSYRGSLSGLGWGEPIVVIRRHVEDSDIYRRREVGPEYFEQFENE